MIKQESYNIKTKWDKKSTIGLLISVFAVLMGFLLFIKGPEYIRKTEVKEYNDSVYGAIISITDFKVADQGKFGERIYTKYFIINYYYEIDGKLFTGTNNIPNYGDFSKFIDNMRRNDLRKRIKVKFKKSKPSESLIDVEY